MYDEYVNIPALALMALGVPFYLLGVHWAYGRLAFMGPNRWEMYQHQRTRRRRLSFSLGGTGYCHGVGNIPVEASGSTQMGTFFSSTSDLVYRSRHLLLAFPCFRLGFVSYLMYSTITLIKSKG